MTHIRKRAQPGVSGKGLAPAWLRPRAEAGGLEMPGVEWWTSGTQAIPGRVKWNRKDLTPVSQNASCGGAKREPWDGESGGLCSSPTLPLTLWPCSFTKRRACVDQLFLNNVPFRSATEIP